MYVKVPGMLSIEGLGLLDWWILAGLGQLPLQRPPIPFPPSLPSPPCPQGIIQLLLGPGPWTERKMGPACNGEALLEHTPTASSSRK